MSHEDPGGDPRLRVTSDALRETRVEASLAAIMEAGKNVVCAGTFGLAWRALEEVAGGPADVEGAEAFSAQVHASACERSDLDEASYVARAVIGPDGLAALEREVRAKLGPGAAPRLLPATLAPDALLVFASLFKQLALATPLARDDIGFLAFKGAAVASFGVWDSGDTALWEARAAQVFVHDHASDQDFVIELSTRATDDRLILARLTPATTLGGTVNAVLARVPDRPSLLRRVFGGSKLKRGEDVRVPVLDFEITHSFHEIEGRTVRPLGRPLARAEQLVRLKLDEHGALLRSEVALELPKSRASRLRSFVFDGPFLVVMMRRGAARPYLALWVETRELLVPIKR